MNDTETVIHPPRKHSKKRAYWSDADVKLLIESYDNNCKEELMEKFPNWTWLGIVSKANKLGMTRMYFLDVDEAEVVNDYATHGYTYTIEKHNISQSSLFRIRDRHSIPRNRDMCDFGDNDEFILNYTTLPMPELKKIYGNTKANICSKAQTLGIKRPRHLIARNRNHPKMSVFGKSENSVRDWLNGYGFNFKKDHDILINREIDMYDKDLRLGVEFCGLYFHSTTHEAFKKKGKNYHYDKYLRTKDRGITLVTVYEDEWNLRKAAVKNWLLSKTRMFSGISSFSFVVSSIDECRDFLNEWSIESDFGSSSYYFTVLDDDGSICGAFGATYESASDLTLAIDHMTLHHRIDSRRVLKEFVEYILSCNPARHIVYVSDNRYPMDEWLREVGFKHFTDLPVDYDVITNMKVRRQHRIPHAGYFGSDTLPMIYGCGKQVFRFDRVDNTTSKIFINDKTWKLFNPMEMLEYKRNVFNHYRANGFPFQNPSLEEKVKEVSKLKRYDTSKLIADNIIKQTFHCLNTAWSYFPHSHSVRCHNSSRSVMDAFDDDALLRKAIDKRIEIGTYMTDGGLRKSLKILGNSQGISNFRPSAAKALYDRYCPENATVWDMSSGYGGRLIGAIVSDTVDRYIGTDPCKATFDGLVNMKRELNIANTRIDLHMTGSEDFTPEKGSLDLCLSSPPYFSQERYSDEPTQSYIKYPTPDRWMEEFIGKTLENCMYGLKDGGLLIVNIASVSSFPDLEDRFLDLASDMGFVLRETLRYKLSSMPNSKTKIKSEPIFVFAVKTGIVY